MQSFELPEPPVIEQHRPQDLRKYSIVPIRAANDRRIRPAAMRVLLAVCSYANRAGLCWPSHENVGKMLGVSRQAAGRQIRILRELGYLHKVKNHSYGRTAQILRVVYDETIADRTLLNSVKFEDLPPEHQAHKIRKQDRLLNGQQESFNIVAVTAERVEDAELVGRQCVAVWIKACRAAGFERLALPEDYNVSDRLHTLGVLRSTFDAELDLLMTSIQGTQREPPHRFSYFARLAHKAESDRRVCSPPPPA
jgi:biotin operon repressor